MECLVHLRAAAAAARTALALRQYPPLRRRPLIFATVFFFAILPEPHDAVGEARPCTSSGIVGASDLTCGILLIFLALLALSVLALAWRTSVKRSNEHC